MKLTNSWAARLLMVTAVVALLLLTAVVNAQAAPVTNQITVRDQNLDTGIAEIDSIAAARSGWVVIYKAPDFTVDNLVGWAPVHEGMNMGVKVIVSLPKIDNAPMLWAVLQADNGVPGVFEWGLKQRAYDDGPVSQNGRVVVTPFATTAPSGASANASSKTALTDRITIHDQDVRSGIILIDSVTTSQPGWVVFYRNPNFTPGEIVGFAPVFPGVNTNVKATIDTTKLGDSTEVWAQLHSDTGRQGVFEWANQTNQTNNDQSNQTRPLADWPLIQNQKYVRTSFSTIAAPVVPTTTVSSKAAQITVRDQNLNTGIIMVDSVTTPYNGWIVIYKDPNLTSGEIVGYAPVYKGTNQDVNVTIDRAKVGDDSILFAVLHTDGGLQNIFEWGYNTQQFSDPPLFQKGQHVWAAFSIAGQ